MKKTFKTLALLIVILSTGVACNSGKVQRVSEDSVIDLNTRWSSVDARLTAEEMTKELMDHPWYSDFIADNKGKKPVIIVGNIVNKTSEHIDIEMFTKDIEKAMIASGTMKLVQDPVFRAALRAERADQQSNSRSETIKKFQRETGADFMLQGVMTQNTQTTTKVEKTDFYQVNLELSNLETNEKVWIGDNKIFKYKGGKKKVKTNVSGQWNN